MSFVGKAIGGVTKALFGGSDQKQSSTQQSSQNLDPRLFDLFNQNFQNATNAANSLAPRQIAGFTPDYYAGRDQVYSTVGGTGQQSLQAAQAAATRALDYNAPTVTGQGYRAVGSNAALANRGDVRDVTGGSFLNANIGEYMNPYLNLVAGNTLNDMERARQIAQTGNANAATAAKAFGGSRQGILEAETNRGYFDRLGNTLGSLYASGFDTASGLANKDLDRTLQASLANQSVDLGLTGLNTSNRQQTNLANQSAFNRAGEFGASATNTANLANQQANLDANRQRLAASGLLGQLGETDQNMAMQRADALMRIAQAEKQLTQEQLDAIRNSPIERQAFINAALGINPAGGSGMVGSSSGSSSGSGSTSPGLLGGLFGGGGNSTMSGVTGAYNTFFG